MHDLRLFFDDLGAWGWAERPSVMLLHRSDLPRLPQPLPRALAPDADTALTAAVAALPDLELDCLWDLPGHGSWLKVPLGKLNTERVVPLDEGTLGALDA